MASVGRVVVCSVMGIVGLLVVIVSFFGIVVNYEEWGVHYCSNSQQYPVCGSIFWLIVEFVVTALFGIVLVVAGLYLGSGRQSTLSKSLVRV